MNKYKLNIEKVTNSIFIASSIIMIILLINHSVRGDTFNINNININNNDFLSNDEINNIINDELENKNIFNVNISKIKILINKHNYIQSSKIYTTYPNNIFIHINEIIPIVLFEENSQYYLVDHRINKIKADIKAINYYSVPIITSDIKAQNSVKIITNSLINIFNKKNELYNSITEIKIDNEEIHYTTEYRTTIKLNVNNINHNTKALINFLNQNKVKSIDSYEYVNLLIPNQIIVKEKSI
jgi:cell division septal protein FtsQ